MNITKLAQMLIHRESYSSENHQRKSNLTERSKIQQNFSETYSQYLKLDPESDKARKLRRFFRLSGTSIKQLRKEHDEHSRIK